MPALLGPARFLRTPRATGVVTASQQAPAAPSKRASVGEHLSRTRGSTSVSSDQDTVAATPLDVLVEDLKFLQAKTGLDLLTPLQEVKEVHDQVINHIQHHFWIACGMSHLSISVPKYLSSCCPMQTALACQYRKAAPLLTLIYL